MIYYAVLTNDTHTTITYHQVEAKSRDVAMCFLKFIYPSCEIEHLFSEYNYSICGKHIKTINKDEILDLLDKSDIEARYRKIGHEYYLCTIDKCNEREVYEVLE